MENKKTILITSFSDLSTDPRVSRQIDFVSERYNVICVGFCAPVQGSVDFHKISRRIRFRRVSFLLRLKKIFFKIKFLKFIQIIFLRILDKIKIKLIFRQYEKYYWSSRHIKHSLKVVSKIKADIVVANDLEMLPIFEKLFSNKQIVFDAHEYFPSEVASFLWKLFYAPYKNYLCKKYLKKVDNMFTVCEGIKSKYYKNYHVDSTVLTNASKFFENLVPVVNREENIKMVHHGVALRGRKIENMIKMMRLLDHRFELDLYLVVSDAEYYNDLLTLVNKSVRVRILDPLPVEKIIPTLNLYDIGLYLLKPTCFNNEFALPNKLFEFIQARLAIAIGPSPEMSKIVMKYDCGIVSSNFSIKSLASEINKLSYNDILYFKNQSNNIARDLSTEANKKVFNDVINYEIEKK